jgi:uncharacterized membrane protein (DUF4010 family)
VVAAVSGVSDMDAIALSAGRETVEGMMSPQLAARATLLALVVNTVFKLGVSRVLGSSALMREVLPALGAAIVAAVVGMWLV